MEAPGSQPKQKRKRDSPPLSKRSRIKKHQGLASRQERTSSEECINADNNTSSPDTSDQDEARDGTNSPRHRAPRSVRGPRSRQRGHDYRHITAQGSARMQVGDTYVEQQNILPNQSIDEVQRRKQKERRLFMENLGFDSMESRLATVGSAQSETCSWLFASPEYLQWRDPAYRERNNGFLWIKGKPGAGKSTIMKHVLRRAQRAVHDHAFNISFFFNARGYGLEKTTEGMYRSMLHQVYSRYPDRVPEPVPWNSVALKHDGWPVPILQNMLRDALLSHGCEHDLWWYIDALDECEEDDIRLAIQHFENLAMLATSHKIKLFICFASRHYPHITISRHETINLDRQKEHRKDIANYITRQLHRSHVPTHNLRGEILRRSSGVFLWAVLVVRIINKMMDRGASGSQLLAELRQVPDGIGELLRNITRNQDACLLPTLQWVLFSLEPFGVDALYFAIKTSVGHLSTAVQDEPETSQDQMRAFILASSRGLVEFTNNADPRAQFIHETVREHLLGGGLADLDHSLVGSVEAVTHARIGRWCHEFTTASARSQERRHWQGFDAYAYKHMLTHTEKAYSSKALDLRSIDAIGQGTWLSLQWGVDTRSWKTCDNETSSVYVLIRCGRTELVKAILQRQRDSIPQTSGQVPTMNSQSPDVSRIPSLDVNAICDKKSRCGTALLEAIHRRQVGVTDQIVSLLLDCGADPNLAVDPLWTPLKASLQLEKDECHGGLFLLLLQRGADLKISANRSLVRDAASWGRWKVVDLLLSYGAIVRGHGTELLISVAKSASPSSVRVLLAAGANVNAHNYDGRTALHQVCLRTGDDATRCVIARELLDAGTNINAMDKSFNTALMLAFTSKRYDLAKLLLDRGTDVNLPQHTEIARRLHNFKGDASAR
jgi:ankyrin repeat protein